MYHYAGNSPIRYVDPDGREVENGLDSTSAFRLEDPIGAGNIPLYDSKTGKPSDFLYGSYDGAEDKDGNYFKVTARNRIIDFEVNDKSLKINNLGDYYMNQFGDDVKSIKNIIKFFKGEKWDILSGFKNKDSIDAKRLSNYWDENFAADCGKNYKDWIDSYNSDTQYSLRKYLNEKEN